MFGRDGVTGITDIDAGCVWFLNIVTPPLRCWLKGRSGSAALPEIRIPVKFDGACPGCEFAGVVQYINKNLLDLAGLEIEGLIASGEVGGDRDRFIVGKGRTCVDRP